MRSIDTSSHQATITEATLLMNVDEPRLGEAGEELVDDGFHRRERPVVGLGQGRRDRVARDAGFELLPDRNAEAIQAEVLALPQIEQHRAIGIDHRPHMLRYAY